MLPQHKRSILIANTIHTFLLAYEKPTKIRGELIAKINKGYKKLAKIYNANDVNQIIIKDGLGLQMWTKTMKKFEDGLIDIEASTCILLLHNKDEKNLRKFFGITNKKLEEFAKLNFQHPNRLAIERNSKRVMDALVNYINEECNFIDYKALSTKCIIKKLLQKENYTFSDFLHKEYKKLANENLGDDEIMVRLGVNKSQLVCLKTSLKNKKNKKKG